MGAMVPSLEGKLYLTDPQSIIAYTMRRYARQPANTMPFLADQVISLPQQVADFGSNPDTLTNNIQSDLQRVFNRIFQNDRLVRVNCTYSADESDGTFDVLLNVVYTSLSGELQQTGTKIALKDGQLVIPEDNIEWMTDPRDSR